MCGAVLLLVGLVAQADLYDEAEPPPPDQQYQALVRRYEEAFRAWTKASGEARTQADWDALDDHPGRNPRAFAGGFMKVAREHPGTTAAEDALIWVAAHTFATRDCEEAKRILVRDHVRSAKLAPALGWQGHYSDYFEGTEAFFRTVLAESPHRAIRGLATYWLARHLLHKAEGARQARRDPEFGILPGGDLYKNVYGADWAARLRRLDVDALEAEAASLLDRVERDYADVPHNDKRRNPGSLGEAAHSYLVELRELAVGKPAPDFRGADLDGRAFRLSDYRGKVVVLDFGSHFYCGQCRMSYPHMKALTERHRRRPFAVVSVHAEPEKLASDLKAAWKAEGNTWRCLFDGDWEGPIQKAWNIQTFPTIYLIDAEGVIRGKNLQDEDLDEAVDVLLLRAEASR